MRAFAVALCVVFAQAIRLEDTTGGTSTDTTTGGPATGTGGSGDPYPAEVMDAFHALPLDVQLGLEAQYPDGPPPLDVAR